MDASDLIKALQMTLRGGARPHMERVEPDHVVDAEIIFRVVCLHVVVPGAAIAGYVWRSTPEQRIAAHLGSEVTRLFVGCMWWQQSLWKLPPYYTDQLDEPFGTRPASPTESA